MNYQQSLAYLDHLGHELRGVKFELRWIEKTLSALDHPERAYPSVIVAGTNGKGSTSSILASILECAGYRTGLYTSPHLVRVNERIRVSGLEVGDDDLARAVATVGKTVDRLVGDHELPHPLSFFEFLTTTAFLHFATARVDFAVLEVGMGGRLDATNVVSPRLAVITNVELDHMEHLGTTHAAIAREKAGVIKPGRPVLSYCEHPDAVKVVERQAQEVGATLLDLPRSTNVSNLRREGGRARFDVVLNGDRLTGLTSPFRGDFQLKNTVTAVAAAWRLAREGFNISPAAIVEGVKKASWPGRLEAVDERPLTLLDGAHNPAAAREIAAFARQEWAGRRLRLVYASMRDKEIGEISAILFPLAHAVYLTQPTQARAARPGEILAAARLRPERVLLEPDPARALNAARQASHPEDVVLACGSLFLVGALKAALKMAAETS